MRVTSNTTIASPALNNNNNSITTVSTTDTTRTGSPAPFPSALIQQLSRFNTIFIQSLNDGSASRNDGLDEPTNSRILHHATTNRQSLPGRAGSLALHRRSSIRDHRMTKRKWRNTHGTTGEFPLNFDIVYCDGGYFSASYNVENILRNDNSVYCSSKSTNINIILKFNDQSQDVMDSVFSLSKIVVKAPTQGYTAPCKEGLLFVSHEQISLEATAKYDDFTESDYNELLESGENGRIEDQWPAAYFRLDSRTNYVSQTIHPNRSGRFVLIKLLRSVGDEDNIDLQYLGLIGYTGPRSFDSGSLR